MTFPLTIPRSVEWKTTHIDILDQQRLPLETAYVQARTIEDVWDCIKTLKVRGAPAIGIAAAFGLALAAQRWEAEDIAGFREQLQRDRDYLAGSRPTAVNLFWALDRLMDSVRDSADVSAAKAALVREALAIQAEDEAVCRRIGEHALALFQDGDSIMTICNAGSLATARYGTALAPFYLAAERGITLRAYACETRPVLQGARLTAWELKQAGIDVTLITDNMAAHTMKTKRIDAVIVGADRIAANGDTANKIGTFGLALLARSFGIPFYVAAPLSTFDPALASGELIPIEERAEEEVTRFAGQRVTPEEIKVYNPAFDVTPHDLIAGIVTEKGILRGNYREAIKALF